LEVNSQIIDGTVMMKQNFTYQPVKIVGQKIVNNKK
jgi:hypothetical protein